MTGLPLFAYGTLRDPEYQRELFGRAYDMRPAGLRGYTVVATPSGYLAAKVDARGTIAGMLVDLDADAYRIADAWEDRTVYDRIRVDADAADGSTAAYIYVVRDARGVAVHDGRLADRSRTEIIADIRRFRASADVPHRR